MDPLHVVLLAIGALVFIGIPVLIGMVRVTLPEVVHLPEVPFGVLEDEGRVMCWRVSSHEITTMDRYTFDNLAAFVNLALIKLDVMHPDGTAMRTWWVEKDLMGDRIIRWMKDPAAADT